MTGTDTSPEACERVASRSPDVAAALIRALRARLTTERTDGRNDGLRVALRFADDAIPTAKPPQTDHYGAHVAGERYATKTIRARILARIAAPHCSTGARAMIQCEITGARLPDRPGLAQARDMLAEAERLLTAGGMHGHARRVQAVLLTMQQMYGDMRA